MQFYLNRLQQGIITLCYKKNPWKLEFALIQYLLIWRHQMMDEQKGQLDLAPLLPTSKMGGEVITLQKFSDLYFFMIRKNICN